MTRKATGSSAKGTPEQSETSARLEDEWIPTVCWGCTRGPDFIKVRRVNGVATNVMGANLMATNVMGNTELRLSGAMCPKPLGMIQKLYHPYRIKGPLKRTNPEKGPGIDPKWVEISWDEALDIVAEKFKKIRGKDSRLLSCSAFGPAWAGLDGTRVPFLNAFGPTRILKGGSSTQCGVGVHNFANYIHGAFRCHGDLELCNYLLLLGCDPSASWGIHQNMLLQNARARGMKTVVVDPVLSATAARADEWLPIKPDTDLAFLLALINVISNEIGVYDEEFLKHFTNSPYLVGPDGYFVRDKATGKVLVWDSAEDKTKTYDDVTVKDFALNGSYSAQGIQCRPSFQVMRDHVKQYTAEWASAITDIPADTIRRIARELVDNARIGSNIKIEGVTLPYRPVHVHIGRPLEGQTHAYHNIMAQHLVAMLLGALEVPGGHCGGSTIPRPEFFLGINAGPDGMIKMPSKPFKWPPVTHGGSDTLLPLVNLHADLSHLNYLDLVNPPPNLPVPPVPEAYLNWRNNPLISLADTEVVLAAIKKIPFIVCIAYVQDEVTELADIVLPDHTELERFELEVLSWNRGTAKKTRITMLRQPVVEPVHNTMDIADIFTELAYRMGFLSEYNRAVNESHALTDPYKLELDKKYPWVEIVGRHCKSATAGAHDLEWFKKNGSIEEVPKVQGQYEVHLRMIAEKLRYPIPYMEQVKRAGEELASNLAKVGVDWWHTKDCYVALPTYVPSVLEEVPAEYDLYVTNSRLPEFFIGTDISMPWSVELAEQLHGHSGILMHPQAAHARGIEEGDEIWVESEVARVKGRAHLSEGLRPDTMIMRGQFGQWATPFAKDKGWPSITPLRPIKHSWTDTVTGNMQGQVLRVKAYKA